MDGLGSPGACTVASVMFQIFVTLWTVAHQVPLSLGLSRKEYWNGLPCPPPEDLLDSGVEPVPAALGTPSLNHWTTREVQKLFHRWNLSDEQICLSLIHFIQSAHTY